MSTPTYDHQSFKAGDVIVETMPLVYAVLPERTGDHCSGCFMCPFDTSILPQATSRLMKCKKCLQIEYCSRECQIFDWTNFHKFECDIYSKHGEKSVFQSKFTRIYLRFLVLMKKRPEQLTRQFDVLGGRKRCFMDQVEHEGEMRANCDFMATLQEVLSSFAQIGLKFDAQKLAKILFKFHINSFSLYDLEMLKPIAFANYIEASIFDHSCCPNAAIMNIGLKMQVRAIKDIAQNEPICISYCGLLQNKIKRQKELKTNYYFNCSCSRCFKEDGEDDKVCSRIDILIRLLNQANSWEEIVKFTEQLIQLIELIHGKYHPNLTSRKVDYYFLTAKCNFKPKYTHEEVLEDLKITHGQDHPLTKLFERLKRQVDPDG